MMREETVAVTEQLDWVRKFFLSVSDQYAPHTESGTIKIPLVLSYDEVFELRRNIVGDIYRTAGGTKIEESSEREIPEVRLPRCES